MVSWRGLGQLILVWRLQGTDHQETSELGGLSQGCPQKIQAGLMAALDTSLYHSFHKHLLSPC